MVNFFLGVAVTSVLWLSAIGVLWVDWERQRTEILHQSNLENYELRKEIANKNRIGKWKFAAMAEGKGRKR